MRRGYRKNPADRAEMARRDALKLRSMISEIEHIIMALEHSIEAEGKRAGVEDRRNLAYAMSVLTLEARLENLKITRTTLVVRLTNLEEQQVPLEATA